MKYTLKEIAHICDGHFIGEDRTVDSVSTDSRNLSTGESPLFVAICGARHDGHAYINELYARGVRAFLTERDVAIGKYADAGFVQVDSSVEALQRLAADYRSKFRGTVVGVTGSNGKTVVKEWIASLVPPGVKLFRSPKSYNSQIGVPLSILMMEGDEAVAVIEAGISQPGEMERLERIVRPDVGVITTIGDAHQEHFNTLGEKLREKLLLFRGARTVVYNRAYALVEAQLPTLCPAASTVDAAEQREAYEHFEDRASQENAAAAVAVCDVLGYDHAQTVARLGQLQPVAMRLELKEGLNNAVIVNDSYNSDINSLAIALDYLRNVAGGRRQTLILSDILQSGFPEEELYGRVAQLVRQSAVDRVVGVGERIKLYGRLFACETEFYPTTDAFLNAVRREDIADRAILIKGNRSSQFERLSHALERKSHTTTLEIDLDAMVYNLNYHRARLRPQTKLVAMVKAAGYGNGTYEVASLLQHQGVDYLAVAFADEGVLLRERGITMPIVVLNADADSFDLMIANRLEPEIYSHTSLASFAEALHRHGERSYPIHLKLDTGMHRLGFERKDLPQLFRKLDEERETVHVSTIFSHLAACDEPAEDEFTRGQIALFEELSSRIMEHLPYRPLRHIAATSAIERMPEAQFDMVRLGIGLYGVGAVPGMDLRQVATLRTRIVQIKQLEAGQTVGYGRAGQISRPTRTATIPIGYADGLNRHLGCGRWSVRVGGKPAPIVGRVCMDTCMVDITDIEASEGDVVTIFGGGPGNGVEDMARVLETIPYEVMTDISARVKRIYTKE